MATFLLVHGSFGGGWVWRSVRPLLRAAGHDVFTARLTGVSGSAHLLDSGITLSTHVSDVEGLLFDEDLSDVLLVGHSYSGMVITGVAAKMPERLKALIYLDAYLPDGGQSEADLWPDEWKAEILAEQDAGKRVRHPPPLEILGISDPEMKQWVEFRMTPQPLATYTEPVAASTPAGELLPRVYIQCTEGGTTHVFASSAEKARDRGWKVFELATGHMAMLTMPREAANLLIEIADSLNA